MILQTILKSNKGVNCNTLGYYYFCALYVHIKVLCKSVLYTVQVVKSQLSLYVVITNSTLEHLCSDVSSKAFTDMKEAVDPDVMFM